tara:strand:+ start:293 stop:1303 length:1011 start_codon:yes stop_codon:yes gene_type:complete
MQISDVRLQKDFNKITFSGYKKSEVAKALDRCMVSGSLERACFWAAELVCSGRFLELWEIIMVTYSQNCFSSAPKVVMILSEFLNKFGSLANGQYAGNELELRNVDHIRTLVAQSVAAVACSQKTHAIKRIKVPTSEFDIVAIPHRMKAPDTSYASEYRVGDPKELFIAVNELAFALGGLYDATLACYWIEWITGYIAFCKKKNVVLTCATRHDISGGNRSNDASWMLWEAIINTVKTEHQKKAINALLRLFKMRYKASTMSKRIYILYAAVKASSPKFVLVGPLDDVSKGMKEACSYTDRLYKVVSTSSIAREKRSLDSENLNMLLSVNAFVPSR